VLEYAGALPARFTLYLYARAQGVSYGACSDGDLAFSIRVETIAENTGMTHKQVYHCGEQLSKERRLWRRQARAGKTGKFVGNVVVPLVMKPGRHLKTREREDQKIKDAPAFPQPLQMAPGKPGLLSENGYHDYLTIPRHLPVKQISRSGLGVLLAALEAISKGKTGTESVKITQEDLRKLSRLGVKAFRSGLKECLSKGLLSYKHKVLTVHDPETRKPTRRWRNRRAPAFYERMKNPQLAIPITDEI
jgi:hypothetical protein